VGVRDRGKARRDVGVRGAYQILVSIPAKEGAMKQLSDDLGRLAIEVGQLGFSLNGSA
jgi:hypothetical protein